MILILKFASKCENIYAWKDKWEKDFGPRFLAALTCYWLSGKNFDSSFTALSDMHVRRTYKLFKYWIVDWISTYFLYLQLTNLQARSKACYICLYINTNSETWVCILTWQHKQSGFFLTFARVSSDITTVKKCICSLLLFVISFYLLTFLPFL